MINLYDPNLSESEVQARLVADTAQNWMADSPDGRTFAAHYNTPQNRQKLAEVFGLLDEAVTLETLSGAFKKLVESGAIRTDTERQAAQEETERQRNEANRAKWVANCEAWLDSHSTNEIKARTERDRAFRSYLQAANRLPQLTVEYSEESLSRQRHEQKLQHTKDAPYLNVPEEVRAFAESYRRMTFAEVQQKIREPQFRAQIEMASKYNLI